jgi:glyoxylase-like metal-dependent hydrolase (beta-lactamase superfamily II)
MQNDPRLIGGSGDDQARKNGHHILKPGRDHPERDKLGRILRQASLRKYRLLDPREELVCRGHPGRREWRLCRRRENLTRLRTSSIAFAFGFRGARKPRRRWSSLRQREAMIIVEVFVQ